MQPTNDVPSDVSVVVEQDGPQKFKIQSGQLEQIGRQLRGRRRFSVFYSLVLPALVTLLTTILTGTFQYLSWINTVRLQAATAVADRAATTYEQAAALVGDRLYSTLVFIPSVRDLALPRPVAPAPPAAPTDKLQPPNAVSVSATPAQPAGGAQPLSMVSDALVKLRYETYYDQLKRWNERYDRLLTDIDYNLDRPILADARVKRTAITVYAKHLKKIDCNDGLVEGIEKAHLDSHSLKLQFAVLNHCFGELHGALDYRLTKILKQSAGAFDDKFIADARDRLDHIRSSANEFRCIALLRIDYYKAQKEKSIVVPSFIRRWLFRPAKVEAEAHFAQTAKACNPENRPT